MNLFMLIMDPELSQGAWPLRSPGASPLRSHLDRLVMLSIFFLLETPVLNRLNLAPPVNDFITHVLKFFIFHCGFSMEAQDLSELLEDICLCAFHLQPVSLSPLHHELNIFLSQITSFIFHELVLFACAELCRHTGLAIALVVIVSINVRSAMNYQAGCQ